MPQQVRIIAGPRDHSWDSFIADLVTSRGYGHEREYVGVVSEQRAEEIRRKLRTAGKHHGVSVRVFWKPCKGCKSGGADCAYHVCYTAFDPAAARAWKARQSQRRR